MAEFLNQDEIDEILKAVEDMEVDDILYDSKPGNTKEKNSSFTEINGEALCDLLIENIPIKHTKELILLANKLQAQSAIINFKDN